MIDDFLDLTKERIPTVDEMLRLCDDLGIGFRMDGDKPVIRWKEGNLEEATVLAKLFKREPFRSLVMAARLQPPPVAEKIRPHVPDGATIIVADEKGNTDAAMKGKAHMWTYEGAETWWYVADYEVPTGPTK